MITDQAVALAGERFTPTKALTWASLYPRLRRLIIEDLTTGVGPDLMESLSKDIPTSLTALTVQRSALFDMSKEQVDLFWHMLYPWVRHFTVNHIGFGPVEAYQGIKHLAPILQSVSFRNLHYTYTGHFSYREVGVNDDLPYRRMLEPVFPKLERIACTPRTIGTPRTIVCPDDDTEQISYAEDNSQIEHTFTALLEGLREGRYPALKEIALYFDYTSHADAPHLEECYLQPGVKLVFDADSPYKELFLQHAVTMPLGGE
jgi:hypothetical protein